MGGGGGGGGLQSPEPHSYAVEGINTRSFLFLSQYYMGVAEDKVEMEGLGTKLEVFCMDFLSPLSLSQVSRPLFSTGSVPMVLPRVTCYVSIVETT